jgi:epoxyqueuosine reductase
MSQEVCPWNVRFARDLPEVSPFHPREAIGANKDARTLARELLAMSPSEFSAAFKGSPMKRAKLQGLKRNAAVVLGNARPASKMEKVEDVQVLTRALEDSEPLVREHASWALARLREP